MIRKILKYSLWAILSILLVLAILYYELIGYGLLQGYGQMQVLWNTRSIEEVLEDEHFPDSLKAKLRLIEEIRQFAIDSLGIRENNNYTTVYDQRGKPILWVVTACPPFSLTPKEWNYAFLGSMSYKGYFNKERAETLRNQLAEEGYDADVDEVSAWSTLGWFQDPILSSMLYRKPGSLASLIIHELTHGTLWIKDQVEYNENLADFVGDKGALLFLEYKYGKESKEYKEYANSKTDNEKFFNHILWGAKKLDSLYKNFSETDSETFKRKSKEKMILSITHSLDTVSFANKKRYAGYFKMPFPKNAWGQLLKKAMGKKSLDYLPNNTYFADFIRYRGKQNIFEKEFQNEFGGNFRKYLAHLKAEYGI